MANGKVSYRDRAAAKKNAQKAEQRRKDQARKAFLEKNGRKITIASVAGVAALIVLFLLLKLFVGPGGSIPNFFGTLRGVQDNWIVTNLGDDRHPRYYKMATFDIPEGYALDPEFFISSDSKNRTRCVRPEEENGINYIYVAGVANRDAQTMMDTYAGYNLSEDEVVPEKGQLGGHDCMYAYVRVKMSEPESADKDSYSMLTVYTDTVQKSSVVVSVQSLPGSMEELPGEEVLLAEAEKAMACLKLP